MATKSASGGAPGGGSNVHVVCRVRPQNSIEVKRGGHVAVALDGNEIVVDNGDGKHKFTFDHVFHPDSAQQEVFKAVGRPLVEQVFQGYNGTIFAYGQTSSGKTHTMQGPDISDPQLAGIVPRTVDAIFQAIELADEKYEFTVRASFVEIYLERIRDLLDTKRQNLQVREDPTRGIYVEGMSEHYVNSMEEMMELMYLGSSNRAQAATGMNEGSSRSHSVFILQIVQKDDVSGTSKTSKVNLVDLAGSEMVRKTGAQGARLEEAKMINLSLSALGNVINSLTDGRSSHIPYRTSKLTRMLQESLGGNARTWLMINVSPSSYNASETLSTLRFGNRAKAITNKAVVNQVRSVEELEQLLKQAEKAIDVQASYIEQLKGQLGSGGTGVVEAPSEASAASSEQIAELNDQIKAGQEELERSTKEISILQAELKELEDACKILQDNKTKLSQELEESRSLCESATSNATKAQDELAELTLKHDELEYQYKELELNLGTLTTENEKLNKELDSVSATVSAEGGFATPSSGSPDEASEGTGEEASSKTPASPPPEPRVAKIHKRIAELTAEIEATQDLAVIKSHTRELAQLATQLAQEPPREAGGSSPPRVSMSRKQQAHMRALQQRLEQLVGVHRQLLRKYASLELSSAESRKVLSLRDARIKQLETSLRNKDFNLKAQTERHAIELEELGLENEKKIHEMELEMDQIRQQLGGHHGVATSPSGAHVHGKKIKKVLRGGGDHAVAADGGPAGLFGWFRTPQKK